jgi:flagellin
MRIYQNIMAMNAQRTLTGTTQELGKNLEKLSSGLRINRAADDAAGLVISENLRSQVSSLGMANRNAQDGVSIVQTAEGQYVEVANMLRRMRDLTIQSMNGSNSVSARTALDAEFQQLKAQITQIGTNSRFADLNLFVSVGSTDFQAAAGVTFQVGFQSTDVILVSFAALNTATVGSLTTTATTGGSILNYASAALALGMIDAAIDVVSTNRGRLGALQNRMESLIRSNAVTIENLAASESRIRDTDMAEETTKFTRNQILQQSGTAMLGQANQVPQSILSLLRN